MVSWLYEIIKGNRSLPLGLNSILVFYSFGIHTAQLLYLKLFILFL